MTKIPEDVMKAAEEALDNMLCNCVESCGGLDQLRAASILDIALAIMAERKRCASLVKDVEDKMGKKVLWLRGEQAYREYHGFSINQMRELRKAINEAPINED